MILIVEKECKEKEEWKYFHWFRKFDFGLELKNDNNYVFMMYGIRNIMGKCLNEMIDGFL